MLVVCFCCRLVCLSRLCGWFVFVVIAIGGGLRFLMGCYDGDYAVGEVAEDSGVSSWC